MFVTDISREQLSPGHYKNDVCIGDARCSGNEFRQCCISYWISSELATATPSRQACPSVLAACSRTDDCWPITQHVSEYRPNNY